MDGFRDGYRYKTIEEGSLDAECLSLIIFGRNWVVEGLCVDLLPAP